MFLPKHAVKIGHEKFFYRRICEVNEFSIINFFYSRRRCRIEDQKAHDKEKYPLLNDARKPEEGSARPSLP